jgi:ribose transport system permease protein
VTPPGTGILRDYRTLVAPVAVVGSWSVLALLNPYFPSVDNALNVAGQSGILAIVAVGELLVIVTGGFDLSVGSVLALSTVVGALAVNAIGPLGLAALAATGGLCGAVNGTLVARFGVPPVIATLGTLLGARGLALLLSDGGQAVALRAGGDLLGLGYGRVAGLPLTFLAAAGVTALATLLTRQTRLGRRLYMVGSHATAAWLVGVPVGSTLVWAYTLSGVASGLAGMLLLGRAGAGLPTEGSGLELSAIASAVVGGAALTGGLGSPPSVFLGAFFIQTLLNGLNLSGVSPFVAELILGSVIVLAGLLDFALRRIGDGARRASSAV